MLYLYLISLKLLSISIILNLHDECVFVLSISRSKRFLGVKEWHYLWPEGRIPYVMDGPYDGSERRLIKKAMREWEKSTCLKFIDRQNHIIHPDYIIFLKSGTECYTNGVGKRQAGPNLVYLGENCMTKRIVLHELGHAIGLYHEHERPDRDEYVAIHMKNVKTGNGTESNFSKISSKDAITLNQTYDYNSVMHYRKNEFAGDRSKDTITPLKTRNIAIGKKEQLSETDIIGVNSLYKCPECGKMFESENGTFKTVIDDNISTTKNKHCEWSIVAARGEQIILNITSLSIVESQDCSTDYLEIKDEFKTGYSSLGRFCGKENTSQTVASSDSRLLVTYHANNFNKEYYGFQLNYYKDCGGDIDIRKEDQEYYLESPNYPNQYPAGKRCVWHLVATRFKKMILKFDYFDLEKSAKCKNDFVEIRDGDAYYSPLVGIYCNDSSPGEIWSTGHTLYVKFVSNGKIQRNGFSAIITLR